ncbi:MAG: Hsp70 family protein [Acidobacteriota bacterium]
MTVHNSDKRIVVGMDLGTTHSLVAVVENGRPRVLRNAIGEALTPSAVAIEGDNVVTGGAALARATVAEGASITAFKRDMGSDRTYTVGGRTMTPIELSACVLRSLKEDVEAGLGQPPDEAVISVPAYFNDSQRRATHQAAELAGLQVERLINEPTAAAIAYGLHQLDKEQQVVVLDLGGGTFDVTVLEIVEEVIEIQSSAGDSRLGGEDFTTALAERFARYLSEQYGATLAPQSQGWARVLKACEKAKKKLSRAETVRIAVPRLELPGGRRDVALDLTRSEAEKLWQPTLERLRGPIRRALRDAELDPAEIDAVLAVGGASRMPCFSSLAEEIFGQPPASDHSVDEVVALGAALQAALKTGDEALEDLVVTDVAPFTLGVETVSMIGGQAISGLFSPILERGTVIPASRVQTYSTVDDRQTHIELKIYQGEHATCDRNLRIGSLTIEGIPPRSAGEESIEVRFTYDLNGVLEVEVTVMATGLKKDLVLEQTTGRLSTKELERARSAMASLKFHPRDALPNTTALARAEALHVELLGAPRQHLAHNIAAFRAALDSQDLERIEIARSDLNGLVASLKG